VGDSLEESRPLSVAAAWAAIVAVIVAIYFGCQAHQDAPVQGGSSHSTTPGETPGYTESPQQPAPGTEGTRHLGDKLSSCSRDLTLGYDVIFYNDSKCATITSASSWGRHDLSYGGHGNNGDPLISVYYDSGQLAMLDATAAGYQGCANDTRYTSYLTVPEGAELCFTGHGVVAGIKLLHHSSPTDYVTLDITVWQGQ
jgi:hypothetical protein